MSTLYHKLHELFVRTEFQKLIWKITTSVNNYRFTVHRFIQAKRTDRTLAKVPVFAFLSNGLNSIQHVFNKVKKKYNDVHY